MSDPVDSNVLSYIHSQHPSLHSHPLRQIHVYPPLTTDSCILFLFIVHYHYYYSFLLFIINTVNVEIFDARKFRALWTGPIIFNFRAH